MAGRSSGDDDLVSDINVTPLVDVVLVLLVIFLITAPALYQSAIKVQLPKAQSGEQAEPTRLDFTLNRGGDVAWGQEKISWNELEKRLSAKKDWGSDSTASVSADEATPHGTVVRLMDLLRKSGIFRFALNVEQNR
jgi:biopolymer transport protein ExbD